MQVHLAPFLQDNDLKGIVGAFQAAVDALQGRIKLAVIDHITSSPPMQLPVKQLTAVCQQHSIPGSEPLCEL